MKRDDFINELERLLMDIPEGDRIDAIEYYYDYFDEAGIENEQKVIRELGSPERVAQTIKENLGVSGYDESRHYSKRREYSEPRDYSEPGNYSEPENYSEPGNYDEPRDYDKTTSDTETSKRESERAGTCDEPDAHSNTSKTSWILIAIIAVLTFPLWIGVVAGLFGAVVGIIGGLFGLVAGLFGAAFGLIIGGIACAIAILFRAAVVGPAEVLVTIGVSALLIAVGLLLAMLFVLLVGKWIPSWIRAIVKGVKGLISRK